MSGMGFRGGEAGRPLPDPSRGGACVSAPAGAGACGLAGALGYAAMAACRSSTIALAASRTTCRHARISSSVLPTAQLAT